MEIRGVGHRAEELVETPVRRLPRRGVAQVPLPHGSGGIAERLQPLRQRRLRQRQAEDRQRVRRPLVELMAVPRLEAAGHQARPRGAAIRARRRSRACNARRFGRSSRCGAWGCLYPPAPRNRQTRRRRRRSRRCSASARPPQTTTTVPGRVRKGPPRPRPRRSALDLRTAVCLIIVLPLAASPRPEAGVDSSGGRDSRRCRKRVVAVRRSRVDVPSLPIMAIRRVALSFATMGIQRTAKMVRHRKHWRLYGI